MCIEYLDNVIKQHNEGFKIIRRLESGVFTPNIQTGARFTFRKWFDAKNFSENNQIQTIVSSDGKRYPAGFHYYLNIEDAISHTSRDETIARVKIKNILVTGSQDRKQVGVSEYMMLMKIVKDAISIGKYRINPLINDIITESLKPLINVLRHSHGKVSDKTIQKIGESVSKTDEDFVDYVAIVDSLRRSGEAFKIAMEIHYRALRLVKRYLDYHTRVMAWDSSLLDKIHARRNELSKQGYRDL